MLGFAPYAFVVVRLFSIPMPSHVSLLPFYPAIPTNIDAALGLSKSCGHSDGTLSSGTARNHVRSLLSPSSLSRQSPTTAADEGNNDNSNKTPRGRMHKSRETTRRSAPLSGTHCERPRSLAPNYCSATISFRIRAGQGADAGTSSGEWNSCICPRFSEFYRTGDFYFYW